MFPTWHYCVYYLSKNRTNIHTHLEKINIDALSKTRKFFQLEEECKIADICRHDQVPICGIDSCGELRTFIDDCDLHEFNCDSKKGKLLLPLYTSVILTLN